MNEQNEKNVTIYMISKYEVETSDIKPVLIHLHGKQGTYDAPLHLVVDGYNEDPRELSEIPSVIRYFKKINKRFNQWLKPTISIDTIKLVMQILLSKKVTGVEGTLNGSMKHIHVREGEWVKLVNKWARVSPMGLEYAAHLAFDAFPMMCKVPGFKTRNPSLMLLNNMIETGYPISQKILKTGNSALKVYCFNDTSIELRLYYKENLNFIVQKIVLDTPNLESESLTLKFKEEIDAWILSITGLSIDNGEFDII
jgi:hypothetical protein